MLGRRGFSGLDRCGRYGKRLILRYHRQRGRCLCLLLLIALPAGSKDGFALGGEALTGTVHRNDRFCVAMWFIHRTKQASCRQLQHLAFAQRQRGHIYLFRADGGNNGVVIGDFFTAAYLLGADGRRLLHAADSGSGGDKAGDAALHIVGQIAAVGARVGTELLFIERLEIVEGLLRGVAENAVGVALEGGQIVERGRFLRLFLALHAFDGYCLALAGVGDGVGVLPVLHSVCRGGKAAIELDGVERFCHKCGDLRLTLYQQRQRGRHDAPNVQCAAIRQGEIPRGVDTNQPISLGAAQGRLMQAVIVAPRLKLLEAVADGIILHRRNPKPQNRLGASRKAVNRAEDQLTLAPSVAGVDHLCHILPAHQLPQNVKLLLLFRADDEAERGRNDGQRRQRPFGIIGIVNGGVGQLCQMPKAPRHDIPAALQIPVMP